MRHLLLTDYGWTEWIPSYHHLKKTNNVFHDTEHPMILTNKVPSHLLVFLYATDIRKLQQGIDVVGVKLKQGLPGKKQNNTDGT